MKQSEMDWFKPLWRRVAVTVFLVAWLGWETFFNHDQLWMAIVGAALLYAVWSLFITFDKRGGNAPAPGADTTSPAGDDDAKPQA